MFNHAVNFCKKDAFDRRLSTFITPQPITLNNLIIPHHPPRTSGYSLDGAFVQKV